MANANILPFNISGSHGGKHEECTLLGCDVQYIDVPEGLPVSSARIIHTP
jgi:hypothetical protein